MSATVTPMRILVVEDDKLLSEGLVSVLSRAGHAVDHTTSGKYADTLLGQESYDLLVLDVGLPDIDGFEVLRRLRARRSPTAVLVLTARDAVEDRVHGLDLGADDYLTKPFEMSELLARLEALLRRAPAAPDPAHPSEVYQFGPVRVDFRRAEVEQSGTLVELSALEFRLLRYFIEHRGATISRDELLNEVWGYNALVSTRTVDVHVAWLRQKVETNPRHPQYILTVHGMGYKFVG